MTHLHCHSIYSVLDGLLKPEDLAEIGKEGGAIALTDHGTCAGHVAFDRACRAEEVKPMLGVEAYYEVEGNRYHITLIAKNNVGYKQLLTLQTNGANKKNKYTLIDLKELKNYSDNIIVLSGCSSGYPMQLAIEGKYDELTNLIMEWAEDYSNFYVEFQPNHQYMKEYYSLFTISQKFGLPFVATTDIHYHNSSDVSTYKNLHKILMKKDSTLELNWLYPWTPQELHNYFVDNDFPRDFIKQCLEYNREITNSVNTRLSYDRKWRFDVNKQEVWDKCSAKLMQLNNIDMVKYVERLSYEFTVFNQLNLLGYLSFCSDILKFCAKSDIPYGPGRGSCVGSLVCYLLDITEVDPIKHQLSFERFLSPSFEKGFVNEECEAA